MNLVLKFFSQDGALKTLHTRSIKTQSRKIDNLKKKNSKLTFKIDHIESSGLHRSLSLKLLGQIGEVGVVSRFSNHVQVRVLIIQQLLVDRLDEGLIRNRYFHEAKVDAFRYKVQRQFEVRLLEYTWQALMNTHFNLLPSGRSSAYVHLRAEAVKGSYRNY